jgi:formate-dependent nitrite reductase cytochrome c552 subunit
MNNNATGSEIFETEPNMDTKNYSKEVRGVIDDINSLQRRYDYMGNLNEILESKAGYRTTDAP